MRLLGGSVAALWVAWVFDVFIGEVRFSIALVAFSVLGAPGVARGAAAGGLALPTGGRARRPVQLGASQGAGLGRLACLHCPVDGHCSLRAVAFAALKASLSRQCME